MINVNGNVTKNFSISEMANNESSAEVKLVLTPEVIEHAQMMQELRDWYGKPLHVSSWYRESAYNKSVGGASNSCHLDARATDINNIPAKLYAAFTEKWKEICKKHNKIGGVCYYNWGMHFDSHSDKFGCKFFRTHDYR